MKLLPVIPLLFLLGCADKLDKDLTRSRIDFGKTCAIFGEVAKQREVALKTFAAKAFATQAEVIKKDWESFLSDHTDAQGCLVSKYPDGHTGPMPVAQLAKALTSRSDSMLNLAMAQKNFEEKQDQYVAVINSFIADAARITNQAATAEEAKESAQAFIDKTLSVLGGIAAGVSTGVLIAP